MPEKALPQPGCSVASQALPAGFGVIPDERLRRFDGGEVLAGGVPERVVRLGSRASRILSGLMADPPAPAPEVAVERMVRPLLDAGLLHPRPGSARMGAGDITVVVPVYNRAAALRRVLDDLLPRFEVVVVDDGSTDGSAAAAREAGATVVARATRGGPAAARNSGLAVVETPLVAFVDSDCRLGADWLAPLLAHFNDPTIAVVAPRVVGDVATRRDALARYETVRSPQDLGPLPGYVRPGARVSFLPAAVAPISTRIHCFLSPSSARRTLK